MVIAKREKERCVCERRGGGERRMMNFKVRISVIHMNHSNKSLVKKIRSVNEKNSFDLIEVSTIEISTCVLKWYLL
jgi:hypothetical protein